MLATLYANAVLSSTGWTSPTNALSAPNASNATASTIGVVLALDLGDVSAPDDILTTSITYGVKSMATNAGSRPQTQLVQLLDSSDAVLASFTTATLSTSTLTDYTATVSLSNNLATVNGYRIRVTTQEGGGMAGTIQHRVDAAWAAVTYDEVSAPTGTSQFFAFF